MITCILLSAGKSSRFGSPKALAPWEKTTLIKYLQEQLINSNIDEIIVVLGSQYSLIKSHILNHKKVKVVYNKDYNFGQTSSFKSGLKYAHKNSLGFMLFPVDFPRIKIQSINKLIEIFVKENPDIAIPVYKGIKGHPPIFSSKLKNELLALDNDAILNTVVNDKSKKKLLIDVNDKGIIESFNTIEEYEKLKVNE